MQPQEWMNIETEWHMYALMMEVIIVTVDGLSAVQCQAIIWINADLSWVGSLVTNFDGIHSKIYIHFLSMRYIWQYYLCNVSYFIEAKWVNSLRPRRNRRHFADDSFKCIFLNENMFISINISLKFIPRGLVNNIPALVQIMAWRRSGDKPLSEPMMII